MEDCQLCAGGGCDFCRDTPYVPLTPDETAILDANSHTCGVCDECGKERGAMSVWHNLRAVVCLKLDTVLMEQHDWDEMHHGLQETLYGRSLAFNIAVRRLGWTILATLLRA